SAGTPSGSYSATSKTWSVPLWCRPRLHQWADYWFDADCQQWDDDEVGNITQATDPVERAYAELHLLPTAPPELVQAAQRIMVKLSHPDAGGSHEAAVAVNLAVELIRAHQRQHAG